MKEERLLHLEGCGDALGFHKPCHQRQILQLMQMDSTMRVQLHGRTENLEENGGIFSDSEAPILLFFKIGNSRTNRSCLR